MEWDGAGEEMVQEGVRPLDGMSGEEFWIGRYGYYCTYQYLINERYFSGPCLTFEGSFTYAVRPDDGDGALSLAVLSHAVGGGGGPVDLLASVPEGAEVSGVRWHFVPDGEGVIEGSEMSGAGSGRSSPLGGDAASPALDHGG